MIAVPKKATTVVLLREETSRGFEVFFTQTPRKKQFHGRKLCLSGGRVDPGDGLPQIFPFCKGLSPEKAHQILGGSLARRRVSAIGSQGSGSSLKRRGSFLL